MPARRRAEPPDRRKSPVPGKGAPRADRADRRKEGAPDPRRRPRRSAEETRGEILDAAQRRLAEGGPEAIRLQEIARDVGISHPAILHHFGSREGLMQALERRVIGALTEEVGRVLLGGAEAGDADAGVDLIESVARAMDASGLARLIAWWVLRESDVDAVEPRRIVSRVVELIRARLAEDAEAEGRRVPSREQIAFSIRLTVLALFGDALIGDALRVGPGSKRDAETRRFRSWLSDLMVDYLSGGRAAAAPQD